MKLYSFTIFIPVRNGAKTIEETLNSLLNQKYKNFNIVIQDNNSSDNTYEIISKYKDKRITIFRNKSNLGYSGNLIAGKDKCHGDILFLMGADDILIENGLSLYNEAFNLSPDIGAVTRPYFWYENNINIPIRAKNQIDPNKNIIVKFDEDFLKVKQVFASLDQLSGLALRKKYMEINFGVEPWISHAHPFINIFTKHPVVYLNKYAIAVKIGNSETRGNIYQISPIISWISMLNKIITNKKQQPIKQKLIHEFVAINYIGLIQIKNYGEAKHLYREIYYLIKYNPKNIINIKFWFITLIVMLIPKFILRSFTDWYKENINSKFIKKISFPYNITSPQPPQP